MINDNEHKLDKKLYENVVEDILQFQNVFYGGNNVKNEMSSGDESLDELLQGGYRRGELTEISGDSNSGKTLLALKAIKQVQSEGKIAIYIDVASKIKEIDLDENEIDKENLIYINLNLADEIGPVLTELFSIGKEDIGLIVIDTLAELSTRHEMNSSLSTNTDLHRSKVIKALLTRISNLVRRTNACAIILNQTRSNFDKEGNFEVISSSERWVKMSCPTRLRLSLDEDNDICAEVSFKEKLF